MATSGTQRLAHLDGLRGVAVLLVIFFHFFERWPDLYPYGTLLRMPLADVPATTGVWLFFVISGFVITLTLHRCASFMEFVVRRFARLWPPMLLCAGITYVVLRAIPGSPFAVSARNFLPSLTFIDPYVYDVMLHRSGFDWMDGVYWTLFVEVQFYALIAVVYFLNPARFARTFLLLSAAVIVAAPIATILGLRKLDAIVETSKLPYYLPFFVIGVGFYRTYVGRAAWPFVLLGSLGVILQVIMRSVASGVEIVISSALVLAMASVGIGSEWGRRVLAARWISSVGLASYSLYLLHQRVGITILNVSARKMHFYGPGSIVLAFAVALIVILVSLAMFHFWEAPLNRLIVSRIGSAARGSKGAVAIAGANHPTP